MDRSGSGGSNNWVIVAIPSKDDYVWELSSEKIPHLTMLHLDGVDLDSKIAKITEFIQHVVDTSLYRFGIQVDRRGVLGDDEADVLFFEKNYMAQELKTIRHYLLTDVDLNKAYHSADQFPSWEPHLTLGYPESPAKPDPRDHPGIYWVEFDRVALWNGDYEGPEFELKTQGLEVASMSGSVDTFFTHHGIKGMKWGVRRSDKQLDAAREADSSDAAAAKETADRIRDQGGTQSISNKDLQNLLDRANLEQRYGDMKEKNSTSAKTQKRIKNMLGHARTVQDIYALLNSPLGKEIRKALMKK